MASQVERLSALEALPLDLCHEIFDYLPIDGHQALLRASPVHQRRYAWQRPACAVLLGPSPIDEEARELLLHAYYSNDLPFVEGLLDDTKSHGSNVEVVWKAVQTLPRRLGLDESTARDTLEYYNTLIRVVGDHFEGFALHGLASVEGQVCAQRSMSEAERSRVVRALCRYEICCNFFKVGNVPLEPDATDDINIGALYTFWGLASLKPWEIEEVLCIHEFVSGYHSHNYHCSELSIWVSELMSGNIHPSSSLPIDWPRPLDVIIQDQYVDLMCAQGLTFLVQTLSIQKKDRLLDCIDSQISFQEVVSVDRQPLASPTSVWQAMAKLRECAIEVYYARPGEMVYPPPTWIQTWEGVFTNMSGELIATYAGQSAARYAGQVFWDADRFVNAFPASIVPDPAIASIHSQLLYARTRWRMGVRAEFGAGRDPRDETTPFLQMLYDMYLLMQALS
ncbi:hypothetical protein CAC42_5347 [Sphaceloma murrayae]|uniref:F-box domain-containing protein n=1 Tax=Sphaceloma murrayae TaxID=2082308 RepID=A0A2K1QUS5_9PEZI|nr:hypothetical protein CAC42_5347 [Sphaceloma murrayae]